MKHRLKISVSKKPVNKGVVAWRKVSVRERSVEELSIQEVAHETV